jgi:phosphate-selective porin OprO/OprP
VTLAAAVLAFAALAPQDTDAERLRRLEEQVRRQQEEIDKLKAASPPFTASLTEGLRFRTPDGSVDLQLGGRFQQHLRVLLDRPDGSARTQPDTFYVRAARLKMSGTFFSDYGFQVEGDFPSSSTGPTPTLQSAYVEWKKLREFRLQVGQFKVPISQERLRSRLFSDFVEDSILTRFVPGYDLGILAYGQLAGGAAGYQAAVVHGRSHLDNAGRSRHDDNDEKELAGRVTFSPWAPDKEAFFLKGLRVGLAGTVTDVDDVAISGTGATAFDLTTPELGVLFFDPAVSSGTLALDGRRTRFGVELSWAVGPACLRAEFLERRDDMVNGGAREEIPIRAWSATLTWILTGEEKNPESRIVPAHPLGEDGGWGALELAARLAGAEIDDRLENLGVTVAGNSLKVRSATVGLNWWPARNVRLSANAVRERFDDPIDLGAGRTEDAFTGFLARFQIDF